LNLSLNSHNARDYCWRVKSDGVSQSNINSKKLAAYPFLLPPVHEQQEIVRRAQQLFSFADQLEAKLTSARQIVERLTPALLAKAFRGELVPQDPNDEPASVLLERIRAARQADAAAGKPSRRRRPRAAANPVESVTVAAPVTPDLLASLLRECGALSERALLAASELDHRSFDLQLEAELKQGRVRRVDDDGQVLMEAAD
jgi:type I restriction enzyme S subunit